VDTVPVDSNGRVRLDVLEDLLTENTALVSIMVVNNEIGSIQPIAEVSRLCLSVDAWLHCDAAQAPAAIDIYVSSLSIDFMSLSSHRPQEYFSRRTRQGDFGLSSTESKERYSKSVYGRIVER
jgi:cysteine desulfurase